MCNTIIFIILTDYYCQLQERCKVKKVKVTVIKHLVEGLFQDESVCVCVRSVVCDMLVVG